MQGAQHQVQSQGAALRKSGREAHAIDIGRLFCLSVSKLLAMWGFRVYSKRLSVRWQFCGLQKWYISVVQVQQTWYLLVLSSLLSSWLMAASIQRSTHLRRCCKESEVTEVSRCELCVNCLSLLHFAPSCSRLPTSPNIRNTFTSRAMPPCRLQDAEMQQLRHSATSTRQKLLKARLGETGRTSDRMVGLVGLEWSALGCLAMSSDLKCPCNYAG